MWGSKEYVPDNLVSLGYVMFLLCSTKAYSTFCIVLILTIYEPA